MNEEYRVVRIKLAPIETKHNTFDILLNFKEIRKMRTI